MADSIVRLRVDSQEYDNKLKRAAEGLNRYIEGCRKVGGTLEHVDDGVKEFTQQLGKMGTVAGGAKGKLGEMTKAFTDLTMQFNQMSEAEKNGQFGKALSSGLDELKQRIISTKQELADINSSLNGGAISGGSLFSSDKLSGMLQVFGGNLMTKGAGMVMSFAGELKDMVAQGIELARAGEGVRLAFQRLGRGDILDGLREATHGTVTDLELMKAAVKFNDFKLPLDELGTMLAFAQQKAKDTGQSVDYMVDSIVTGLGRKSLMILDNLGLSAAEVKEKMAETGDMTKAVGAIIREQMSKAGDYVETAADRATQANVSLQNKMEELGRKFAPIEEASNQLWTSMKIGILDVVGGPLARLLNGLTEAGRLKNMLDDMNGGGNGKETQTEKALRLLRQYSGGGRGIEGKRDLYNRQMASYSRQEEKAWREANRLREELNGLRRQQKENGLAGNLQPLISDTSRKLEAAENRAKAFQIIRANYEAGSKGILNPTTDNPSPVVVTNTTGGTSGTTTTTTTKQTPQQRAQESFTKAEQNYKQALEQATLELQAGTITRAEAKKKEMQAAETRWKAIGDARNINDSEPLRKAQDEAAAEYTRLAAEAKTATEHQKAVDKATRDLENANQKLATARTEMAKAKQQGDLQAYNAAKDKATAAQQEITRLENVKVDVETGTVDLPDIPKVIEQIVNTHQGELMTAEIAKEITQTINTRLGRIVTPDILESITQTINTKVGNVITPEIAKEVTQVVDVETGTVDLPDIPATTTTTVDFEANTRNIDAAISYVKKEMDTIPVGTIAFNLDQTKLADLTTLKTLISEQMKNGLQIDPNFAQSMFSNILAGKDIENTTWQAQVDNINEKLKEMKLDPLKIDFKTGEVAKTEKDNKKNDDRRQEAIYGNISRIAGSVQGMLSTLETMGIEIPDELQSMVSGIQSIMEFMSAMTALITTIAGTSTIKALPVIGAFAHNGAVIHAAGGAVTGNTYSGDKIPAMLNAGEVVLNRAQTGNIASQLSGTNGGGQNAQPYVTGDIIFLGLQNYLQENGYGKLMTTNMR